MSTTNLLSQSSSAVALQPNDGATTALAADSAFAVRSHHGPAPADEAVADLTRTHMILKRTLDIAVSSLLLLLMLPVVAVAALMLLIDSPGPLFFRSERVGYGRRPLKMLKFRKMHPDAPSGPGITVDDDERFTRVGLWLAKLKIDEVPQLWHVLRGEMSLVGPRPEDPRFVKRHDDEYSEILQVRPGMTGLSQLAFAEEARILDDDRPLEHYLDRILPQKLGLDRIYASRYTIWFDVRILFWTVVAVFARRPVAVNRSSGAMSIRKR